MDITPEARLARIAQRQAGAFNRDQARAAGLSPWKIARRTETGEFRQLEGNVWAMAGSPLTWDQECWAATLTHPHAALSHSTAAHALHLDVDRQRPLHVTVPLDAAHRTTSVVTHRSRHHRVATYGGLAITRFEQVMVQLAADQPELVMAALHSGVDANPMRLELLFRHLHRLQRSRLPGLGALLDAALDLEDEPPTQSELERQLLDLIASIPGVPAVTRQVDAPWATSHRFIVDATIEPWRLIVEADGRRFHARRSAFETDRWRDAEAAIAGYHVMRFTYRRLERDSDGIRGQLLRYGQRVQRDVA